MFELRSKPSTSDVFISVEMELERASTLTDEELVGEIDYFKLFVEFTIDVDIVCSAYKVTGKLTKQDRELLENTFAFTQTPLCINECGEIIGGYLEFD